MPTPRPISTTGSGAGAAVHFYPQEVQTQGKAAGVISQSLPKREKDSFAIELKPAKFKGGVGSKGIIKGVYVPTLRAPGSGLDWEQVDIPCKSKISDGVKMTISKKTTQDEVHLSLKAVIAQSKGPTYSFDDLKQARLERKESEINSRNQKKQDLFAKYNADNPLDAIRALKEIKTQSEDSFHDLSGRYTSIKSRNSVESARGRQPDRTAEKETSAEITRLQHKLKDLDNDLEKLIREI